MLTPSAKKSKSRAVYLESSHEMCTPDLLTHPNFVSPMMQIVEKHPKGKAVKHYPEYPHPRSVETKITYFRDEEGKLCRSADLYCVTGYEPYVDEQYNLDYRPVLTFNTTILWLNLIEKG